MPDPLLDALAQEINASSIVASLPTAGTVLAFDFGEKRVGVALGELTLGVAHPLTTINEESNERRFAAVEALIKEWQPVYLVVGLPTHMDGTEHALSALCRKFARRLEGRFAIRVALVDERLTSVAAESTLNDAGVRGRKQKPMLDQVAAQHILQAFLDGTPYAAP